MVPSDSDLKSLSCFVSIRNGDQFTVLEGPLAELPLSQSGVYF